VTTTIQPAEGLSLVHQCALPLSRQTLTFVAGVLRARLKIGSRWRKLPPGKIALIVLATLWHDHRLADMAGGNGVSSSTIDRWTWEIIGLLAARAPRLGRALAAIKKEGGEAVLLDGTLIPTRRRAGTANRKNYNGKHKKHGLLFLALTDQAGNLIWISSARRDAASEITVARHDHITGTCAPPDSAPWPTSASPGWTPAPKIRSSSPATRPPRHASSPPPSATLTRPLHSLGCSGHPGRSSCSSASDASMISPPRLIATSGATVLSMPFPLASA